MAREVGHARRIQLHADALSDGGEGVSRPPSPLRFWTPAERLAVALRNALAKTGIPAEQILGRSRHPAVCYARKLVWCDMHANGASYSEIGRLTGRDHSSVMAGVRSVARQTKKNPASGEGRRGGGEAKLRR